MAAGDVSQIQFIPGRLSRDPVNVTPGQVWPFGGTGLGLVQDIVVKPMRAYQTISEESFGVEVVDVLDLGESWVLSCALRTGDPDAIAAVFASTPAGVVSGKTQISYPGTFRAGTLRSTKAVKLLFTPDDPVSYPMFIFYNALPLVEATAELTHKLPAENLVAAVFVATRDASNRVCQRARQEDMVL